MSAIDVTELEELRDLMQKRLERLDRNRRNEPLHDAMMQRLGAITTMLGPQFMADSKAEVRKSVLALEKGLEEFPQTFAKQEADHTAKLARVRARTAMLRNWLEVLS